MIEQLTKRWETTLAEYGYGWPEQPPALGLDHRPAALCYVRSNGRVLLLQRERPPFAGRWTAPGGKLRADETPLDAVRREIREETGLVIADPSLRMIVVESGPTPLLNWLLFVFATNEFHGTLRQGAEGPLRWVQEDDLHCIGMPDIDLLVSRYVLAPDEPRLVEVSFDALGRPHHLRVSPLTPL